MRIRVMLLLAIAGASSAAGQLNAPPAEPARIASRDSSLVLVYDGGAIFACTLRPPPGGFTVTAAVSEAADRITQTVTLTAVSPRERVSLQGTVSGSGESIACEADRSPRGIDLVRHSWGPSRSLLNRAVYDRSRDWVLSVDHFAKVRVTPLLDTPSRRMFTLEAEGSEIVLRFRPRYYQKHRGLRYFEPWTYMPWKHSVAGWCSWYAYGREISEAAVLETAGALRASLRPFGLQVLQIDDGYQRGEGVPSLWLTPNGKFPSGLDSLAGTIRAHGLTPGIWTAATFRDQEFAAGHPGWFVTDSSGAPARGRWIDYSVDASNRSALDSLVVPVYRALKQSGWGYFKVDALRHLRYEGYNAHPYHFARRGLDRADVFRQYALAVRGEIGRDAFMLGCWGIRPELAGIIDGCRIGDDGFSFAGLAQFNSFNNILWRNDPDHIELSDAEAYRSCMVTSLTGSLFMLTDRPARYAAPVVEPARRSLPVPVTVPGQIFDVDPSRSDALQRVESEVSGSGPRPFDAGYTPRVHLFALEVNRPFESWLVLGRTAETHDSLRFEDLGLSDSRAHHVYEFWSGTYLGAFRGSFRLPAIDRRFNCQLLCIREERTTPWVLATSRHITCGGEELEDLRWDGRELVGTSRLIGGDEYTIRILVPHPYRYQGTAWTGADDVATVEKGRILELRARSATDARLEWNVRFRSEGSRSQ